MDSQTWIQIGTVCLVPLTGVVVAIIADRRSKNTTTQTVAVSEQEADTHQFAALTEGFVEQLRILKEDVAEQRGLVKSLTERVETLESQKLEMLAHILALEVLVPNPPGPPKRPWL